MDNLLHLLSSGSVKNLFKLIYEHPNDESFQNLLDLMLLEAVKLHHTCVFMHQKVFELLRHGAKVDILDDNSDDKMSPLQASAKLGDSKLIEILLHFGASVKLINNDGDSILHLVVRSGDTLSLSLLLCKVFQDTPELFEINNGKKKKFYDLFKTRDQAFIWKKFQESCGLKLKGRSSNEESNRLLLSKESILASLIAIDDIDILKKINGNISSIGMKSSINTFKNRSKKKSENVKLECEFISKYANISSPILKNIFLKDFSNCDILVDSLEKGNPFNLFNYACTLLQKKDLLIMINTMQPRLKQGDIGHLTIKPVDSLKRFYPDLVDGFLFTIHNQEVCSICKDTDAINHQKWTTLNCKHTFHLSCIEEWFQFCLERTCPVCRRTIFTVPS